MRSAIICVAVMAHAKDSMDSLVDKLVERAFDRWSLHNEDLESTTLQKGTGTATPGRVIQMDPSHTQVVPSARSTRMPFGQWQRIPSQAVIAKSSIPKVQPFQRHGHHTAKAVAERVPDVLQEKNPVIAQLALSDQTKAALAKAFASLQVHYDDIEAFEQATSQAFRAALSSTELAAYQSIFSADGPASLHVTNLPVTGAGNSLIPTPNDLMDAMKPVRKDDLTSEACLVGTAGVLGASCFTYSKFYGEDMVRNFPRKQGSELGWHRDGVTAPPFRPPTQFFRDETLVPELVIIFCLRGNAQARTMIVDFAALVEASDKHDIALLRAQPLVFHDTSYNKTMEPFHVVKGTDKMPVVELRPIERFEVRGDKEVISAYRRIYDLAERMHSNVALSAGEMLIVNNKRCSHARTPYTAKADAKSDRWLQNVYASRRAELWDKQGQSYVQWPERHVP